MNYSYIPELKAVFADKDTAHKLAIKVFLRRGYRESDTGQVVFKTLGKYAYHTNSIRCLFGACRDGKFSNYSHRVGGYFNSPVGYANWERNMVKNGVEILGLQPCATGHTFSNKCLMTIPELKEACKKNGIKVKSSMKKQDLLNLLMKV